MGKGIKKILSLTLILSIFAQVLAPGIMPSVKANEGGILTWEKKKSLNKDVRIDSVDSGEDTELLSWKLGDRRGDYTLEYYVQEGEEMGSKAQKVQFKFNKALNDDNSRTTTVKILDYNTQSQNWESKPKVYKYFDFGNPTANNWLGSEDKADHLTLPVEKGSNHPGGIIRIGSEMEIRYRWDSDGTMYFQTDFLKKGHITPFSLKYEAEDRASKIEVLSGLEDYSILPMHIKVDGDNIIDESQITKPGEESPGSKPGLKIGFKKPKTLTDEFKFDYANDDRMNQMKATLVLADLTERAKAQLEVDFGQGGKITGLGNKGKEFIKEKDNKYTFYLSEQEHSDNDNIVHWGNLEDSMIIDKKDLVLAYKDIDLGTFTPPKGEGGYTYLGYDIKKSSVQDAYLEIMPYKGTGNTEFTYIIHSSPNGVAWTPLVKHKYMPIDGGKEEVTFNVPVPLNPNADNQYYKVTIDYGKGITSQELHYEPKRDLTIPPPVPTIQSVENVYVVPPEELKGQPQTIGFDITWRAPRNDSQDKELNKLLKEGHIYYELYLNEVHHINTFKASLKNEGKDNESVILEPYAGTSGKDTNINKPEIRYNMANDTFTMENVVLKNVGQANWEQITNMPKAYETQTRYPSLEDKEFKVENNLNKEAPGIYYLSMRALYDPIDKNIAGQEEIKMGVSNESNAKSISISTMKEVVPVPTKIESKNMPDDRDTVQEISWNSVDLSRYKRQMLDPLGLKLRPDDTRTYEMYLYTDKEVKEKDFKEVTPASISLNVSKNTAKLSTKHLEHMRNGKAVRLDYTDAKKSGIDSIKIENLDPNQVYYMSMRVRLDLLGKENKEREPRFSIFSKQHTFTSYIRPGPPEPGEIVPPVPGKLQVINQPNNTTAVLGWEAPEYKKQDGEKIYYELLKVDSRKLLKEEDSRLLDIEKLIDAGKKDEMQGWTTKNPYINTYNKVDKRWIEASPKQAGDKLTLEDSSLRPNNIYYYYVRTVLVTEGEEVYSSWIGIPVTTDPVKKPIQLRVETQQTYSHNPKEEIVISFMAPVPSNKDVPSKYDFDIAVQSELDDDYKLDYKLDQLTSKEATENIPQGYTHFVYKIKDLKPGKRYDIKVRVIDKLEDKVDGQYPKSLYSDRATTRTAFDQDEQDKEDKFAQYIQYFEDRAEALRRKPYWEINSKKNTFAVKYRSSYLEPEMKSHSTYSFVVDGKSKQYEYYLPAKVVQEANINKTSFEVVQGEMAYIVRPEMLSKELGEIKETIIDIDDKRIRDYYILFTFTQGNEASYGNITPEVRLETQVVQLREKDFIVEDNIMVSLNDFIQKEKKHYINDLEKALDRGTILKEDLDPLVDKALGNIEKAHKEDVRKIVRNSTNRVKIIENWNKGMLVIANNIFNSVGQGYYRDRTTSNLPTFRVNGGFALEADKPGLYGFTGQRVNITPIPGVPGTTDLVVKYGLTEFFGYSGYINPEQIVTKRQLYGASAKVLGADTGADYLQYLRQVGIKGMSNIGQDRAISKQEGIYLLMQVYEKILRKPINTVYIQNRNSVPNLWQFNQIYQPYVLVAVDSKLVSGPVRPNDNMKTSEVLQMLTNILKEQR